MLIGKEDAEMLIEYAFSQAWELSQQHPNSALRAVVVEWKADDKQRICAGINWIAEHK